VTSRHPATRYALTIKRTKRDLLRRRREIVRGLGVPLEDFLAKVCSSAPLSNREWSNMEELKEIAFLLGEDRLI
jgi:hypothetical protein